LIFTLLFSFVEGLNVFPYEEGGGLENIDESNVLSILTGLKDSNMNYIWLSVTTLGAIGVITLAIAFKTMMPVGLWLFGTVFWTAWIRTSMVINTGGYIPAEFLVIFTVVMIFVFIAAYIGMITGSG